MVEVNPAHETVEFYQGMAEALKYKTRIRDYLYNTNDISGIYENFIPSSTIPEYVEGFLHILDIIVMDYEKFNYDTDLCYDEF